MATRNILKDGERGLEKTSRVVTDFNKRLHILLDDMRETLIEANGLGLAAPQVGVLRRAVLIVDTSIGGELPEDAGEEEINKLYNEQIIEMINPEIISSDGEQTGSEGCLSVPGVYGMVTRPNTVLFKAQDRNGKEYTLEVSELAARAVCHEIDHLNGVLFTSVAERILSEEEMEEMRRQNEQSEENDSAKEIDNQ